MVFKSDKEIDTRIGKAYAVLHEFYRSVVTKLLAVKSVFVPIPTSDHEYRVMTI